jgi:sulfite exporter TauE/SafE
MVGYAALGALAAASMQGLGWLTVQSVTLRPLWTFLHIAAIVLGLLLLWRARQPPWLETLGSFLWTRAQSLGLHRGAAPGLVGMLWALLPCGLLYSAVMVSALAGSVAGGAVLMALFALGSGITMLAGPWLWLRLAARIPPAAATGDWGVRLAGAALAASAAWALWMGLVHDTAPWCVVV